LSPRGKQALVVDATLGEGGHAEAFLEQFPEVRVIGVEVDEEIGRVASRRLERFGDRFVLWQGWFSDFFGSPGALGGEQPDRVLFDLGISSFHYQRSGRGFSFDGDEPLDMRLQIGGEGPSAAELVSGLGERELADLFYRYGEERYSRRIAAAVVRRRRQRPIRKARDLADIVRGAVPSSYRHGRIHPATRCFQALRVAVNDELDRIEPAIEGACRSMAAGGRIGVIAFHSLEDRIVKNLFREWSGPEQVAGLRVRRITRKPARPSEPELRENPSARSARFRVVEKVG
jgi:16S rRNA (cytosine1402-N4)-methyltransferase